MYLHELKLGDEITHYCYGQLVTGKVVNTDGIGVCTEHEAVRWGNHICINTWIHPSTHLQRKWGGTDKNGQPCKGPEVTPGAWYKGEPLKSKEGK